MFHEYVFEVKVAAVCHVRAKSPRDAKVRMRRGLRESAIRLEPGPPRDVWLSQASMDDVSPLMVEIDGKEIEE